MQHPVPKSIWCYPTESSAFHASVRSIDEGGIFVAARPDQLSYGDSVRVAFDSGIEPSVLMEGRVLTVVRDKGARIEASLETSQDVLAALAAWARGESAEVSPASTGQLPRVVPREPEPRAQSISSPSLGMPPSITPTPKPSGVLASPEAPPLERRERSESSPDPRALGAPRDKRRLVGAKVLLVDDDVGTVRALSRLIRLEGAEVFATHDPSLVISLLSERDYDAVLLDWMLPKIPGAEVLAQIRAVRPKLPVLVISGALWWESAAADIRMMGATRVLAKPLDVPDLIGWIESEQRARASSASPGIMDGPAGPGTTGGDRSPRSP